MNCYNNYIMIKFMIFLSYHYNFKTKLDVTNLYRKSTNLKLSCSHSAGYLFFQMVNKWHIRTPLMSPIIKLSYIEFFILKSMYMYEIKDSENLICFVVE